MKQVDLVIQNQTGLHARPAKVLVNLAKQYQSDVRIVFGEKKVNAKSMVSVLTLGASRGAEITLVVSGEDEDKALFDIEAAIRAGLGDEMPGAPAAQTPAAQTPAAQTPAVVTAGEKPQPAPAPVAAPPVVAPPVVAPPVVVPPPVRVEGVIPAIAASPGIAIGPVFHFGQPDMDLEAEEAVSLRMSLHEALDCARGQLFELCQEMKNKKMAAEGAIFEAHIELMDDPELLEAVEAGIQAGERPQMAWKRAIAERAVAIAALPDPILSARADDMRDVGRRVLCLMLGLGSGVVTLPDWPVIIIARELSPSETATFDSKKVLGFGIVNGGPTSHIAILARAMGLPAIVGADESILDLAEKATVILDGSDGSLITDPLPEQIEQAVEKQRRWLEMRQAALEHAGQPATTLDGHHVDVTANAGSVRNAEEAVKKGADGIGLLRTEFLFLERSTAPSEDEQYEVYRAIGQTMGTRPVIIRTLDIGGDKPVPYIEMKPEMNPFLGERGLRLCLNRTDLFRDQLRAILRAASYGTLRIMFPMVGDIGELRQARAIVDELRSELNAPEVQIGIMIEVPSAAIMAEKIAPEIDFFSIGTNDLTQYTLAVDRANSTLAAKHDGLHPAVLRLIALTIDAAHRYGKRADICGELGSDPAAIPILVGLGMDELSVSIPSVPTVKAQVRELNLADLQPLARRALDCSTAQEVRELVKQYRSQ